MLQVVHAMKDPPLVGFQHLPKYEFVQDIEETPDVAIQESTKFWALVSNPVDSFWFFELDSPKVEKKLLDLSHLGATATIETSTTGFVNNQLAVPSADLPSADAQVPIAVPGTYQLFLPDPEMMNRLGEVPPREIYQAEQNNKPTIPIEHPSIPAVVALPPVDATPTSESHATSEVVEQLCRLSRSSSKKRVVIADPPVSGSQSPPSTQTPRSKSRKLYSYQRPRSPSFTTRLLTATQRVNSTYSERKTMENLTASMKSASELLERRRAARSSVDNTSTTSTSGTSTTSTSGTNTSTSRYVPDSNPERGRASTRYQVPTVPTASSSYRSDTSNASSGASLWGLLDMAQSWIMKSRRDRSEEKSRYLIRKTRQF